MSWPSDRREGVYRMHAYRIVDGELVSCSCLLRAGLGLVLQ